MRPADADSALWRRCATPIPEVRIHAQVRRVAVWSRSGDPEVDALLKSGDPATWKTARMGQAVEAFTRITERQPDFAEGWNKRATAYYLIGRLRAVAQGLRRGDQTQSPAFRRAVGATG